MSQSFPVSSGGLAHAFEFVRHAIVELRLNEALAHRISVILDELCSNMIRYDDTLTPETAFDVTLTRRDADLLLRISDPGQPFDPLAHQHHEIPEIGGHGISLVKGLSETIAYSREQGCNVLTMTLEIDP